MTQTLKLPQTTISIFAQSFPVIIYFFLHLNILIQFFEYYTQWRKPSFLKKYSTPIFPRQVTYLSNRMTKEKKRYLHKLDTVLNSFVPSFHLPDLLFLFLPNSSIPQFLNLLSHPAFPPPSLENIRSENSKTKETHRKKTR